MRPRIFISAVTKEFGSARQRVADILTRLGYEPVSEEIFGTESGDLRPILRRKLESCQGLIQLVGEAYGAEPPEPDAEFGRVSYTQFEFHHARKLDLKTWLIFPGDACLRDTPVAELDSPPAAPSPEPVVEQCVPPVHPDRLEALSHEAERRALQAAYRERLRRSEHLYHEPKNDAELELVIERLKLPSPSKFRVLVGLLVLLAAMLAGGFWWTHREAVSLHQLTKEKVQVHLLEASQKKLAEDLAAAEQAKGWEERERLREAAQQANASRTNRINQLAETFAQLEGRADASTVLKELTRILREQGVDAALAYVEHQRPGVLERVRARKAGVQQENRAELQPLLQAAQLRAAKGDSAAARAQFREVLKEEPDWPEALQAYVWFLFNQAILAKTHGTLRDALDFSEDGLAQAEHYARVQPTNAAALRALSAMLNERGDVLVLRAQPGDSERILACYQRSLDVAERLFAANKKSTEAARDVAVSLNKLADFLADRGLPGDAEKALGHYQRSLEVRERLLAANKDSAQAARDVSVSLDRLADFLAGRGLPGDAEKALGHYQRSLEVRERLLAANPDSAQAARDVATSHWKLHVFHRSHDAPDRAKAHREKCFAILDSFARAGRPMDAQMRNLYEKLKPLFPTKPN